MRVRTNEVIAGMAYISMFLAAIHLLVPFSIDLSIVKEHANMTGVFYFEVQKCEVVLDLSGRVPYAWAASTF